MAKTKTAATNGTEPEERVKYDFDNPPQGFIARQIDRTEDGEPVMGFARPIPFTTVRRNSDIYEVQGGVILKYQYNVENVLQLFDEYLIPLRNENGTFRYHLNGTVLLHSA